MKAQGFLAATCLVLGLVGAACGPAEVPDPQYAFEPYAQSTVFTYSGNVPTSTTGNMMVGAVGTTQIGGKTIPKYQAVLDVTTMTDLVKPGHTAVDFYLGHEGETMVVGGFSHPALLTATVNPPVNVPLNPPVGVAQTVTLNGMATPAGQTTAQAVTLTAQVTLLDPAASVVAPMGTVTGCNHYTANWSVSGPGVPAFLPAGPFTADVYYHPTLGLMKANIPELSISVGLAAEADYAGTEPGTAAIRKIGYVQDGQTHFDLSTYDRAQALDADKLTHAKMLVELRWADDATAKLGPPPGEAADVNVEFNGGFGYFPSMLVESPSSYFYPTETGYRYSYGFVSQALKNEGGTRGSAYTINVNQKAAGVKPIRVTARIVYNVLTVAQQAEPMPPFN